MLPANFNSVEMMVLDDHANLCSQQFLSSNCWLMPEFLLHRMSDNMLCDHIQIWINKFWPYIFAKEQYILKDEICERQTCSWPWTPLLVVESISWQKRARYGLKMAICQLLFLEIHRTCIGLQVTFKAIPLDPIIVLTC